jgi:hypothetical protein
MLSDNRLGITVQELGQHMTIAAGFKILRI